MESAPSLLGFDILQHCKIDYKRIRKRLHLILEM
jgi:hypothetical protein